MLTSKPFMLITVGYSNNLCVHSAIERNFSYFQFFLFFFLLSVFHCYKQDFGKYSHAFFLEHSHESFSREIYPSQLLFHKGCLSIAIYMAVTRD